MQVDLLTAYKEACRLLGEANVRESLQNQHLDEILQNPPLIEEPPVTNPE
jgi:hypothetical protein